MPTPHEEIQHEKPDVTTLQVFGCGAYVYIPEDKRANKLAPRSELMTYIGVQDGVEGYCFMQLNGTIFLGATATFDETLFPYCKGAITPHTTEFDQLPPNVEEHNHSHGSDDDGDDDLGPRTKQS